MSIDGFNHDYYLDFSIWFISITGLYPYLPKQKPEINLVVFKFDAFFLYDHFSDWPWSENPQSRSAHQKYNYFANKEVTNGFR